MHIQVGRLHNKNLYTNPREFPHRVYFGEELILVRGLQIYSYREYEGTESNVVYLSKIEKLKFSKGKFTWHLNQYEFPVKFFYALGHSELLTLPNCDLPMYDGLHSCGVKFSALTFIAYADSEVDWETVDERRNKKPVELINMESIWNDKDNVLRNLFHLTRRPALTDAYTSAAYFSKNGDAWYGLAGVLYNLSDLNRKLSMNEIKYKLHPSADKSKRYRNVKPFILNDFSSREDYDFVVQLMEAPPSTLIFTSMGAVVTGESL